MNMKKYTKLVLSLFFVFSFGISIHAGSFINKKDNKQKSIQKKTKKHLAAKAVSDALKSGEVREEIIPAVVQESNQSNFEEINVDTKQGCIKLLKALQDQVVIVSQGESVTPESKQMLDALIELIDKLLELFKRPRMSPLNLAAVLNKYTNAFDNWELLKDPILEYGCSVKEGLEGSDELQTKALEVYSEGQGFKLLSMVSSYFNIKGDLKRLEKLFLDIKQSIKANNKIQALTKMANHFNSLNSDDLCMMC